MKGYHDIVGDGGSRILEQVAEQADPHHRRARRRASSRGRGLRQRRRRQEHVDAASRGRAARPGAADCDPGRGLQRPLTGAHGRCPGSAVRSRQPQSRAPADQRTGSAVFSMGSLIPESESLEFESTAHGESHTWRATREFALLGEILGSCRVGRARSVAVRSAAGRRADCPVRRFSRAADLVRARDDPFRSVTRRGRAIGGSAVEGTQSRSRLRREHERLLLPRLQRDQAALRCTRVNRPWISRASGPFHSIPSSHDTAIRGCLLRNCPTRRCAVPWTHVTDNLVGTSLS